MDTKYWKQVLDEYIADWVKSEPHIRVPSIGELPITTISLLLDRAQKLKENDTHGN